MFSLHLLFYCSTSDHFIIFILQSSGIVRLQRLINSCNMKNYQLNCPKCCKAFSQTNPPKSLINCSHSLCLECLQQEIVCPLDKSRIQLRKYKIDAFPTNMQILQQILNPNKQELQIQVDSYTEKESIYNVASTVKKEKQLTNSEVLNIKTQYHPQKFISKSSSPIVTTGVLQTSSYQSNQKSFQTCLLHSKKADLICIQDKKLICADCGLFGDHKPHQLISYDKFIGHFSEMTEECFQTFNQLHQRQQKMSLDLIQQEITRLLAKKKEEELFKIKNHIRFYSDLLRVTQKQLISKLQLSLEYKKQKLTTWNNLAQLQNKMQEYFISVQRMSEGLSQILNRQNLQQYVCFLDKNTKDSQIQKTGLYLLVQVDNFQKMKQENIEREIGDLHYQFSKLSNIFEQTYKLDSKDRAEIDSLADQAKQKNNKTNKMQTPARKTTVLIQSNKGRESPLNNEQQQSLLSPAKTHQQSSPQQPSPSFQSLNLSNFDSRVTEANKHKVSPFATSRIIRIPKNPQISSKNGSSQKLKLANCENDRKDSQRRNSKGKSINKNSNEIEFFNILGEKNTENKKKKKLQLPQKQAKIYEDLLKDKLEVLDLGKGYLGNAHILAISELFPTRSRLKTVKLMNNRLTDQIFGELVSRCKGLNSLNLGGNQLSERCLQWLQREVGNLGELKTITLSCNKIVLRNVKERLQLLKERGLTVSL